MDKLFNFVINTTIGIIVIYSLWYISPKRLKGQIYIFIMGRKIRNNLQKLAKIRDEIIEDYEKKDKKVYPSKDSVESARDKYLEISNFKENIFRSLERYKHDNKIWWNTVTDLTDYAEAFDKWLFGYKAMHESGVDVISFDEARELNVKMYEIDKRITDLIKEK